MTLALKLAQAKSKLMMIEKENETLRTVRKEIKIELAKVNAKINESEVLNKFLLENHQSREELFDQVSNQIKILRELKSEKNEKQTKVNNAVVEFLMQEQKDKEQIVQQSRELEDFLNKVKVQIGQLEVPNFENLVRNKVDLAQLEDHNEQQRKLQVVEENLRKEPEDKKPPNFLRKSMNYKSTGESDQANC